MSLAAWLCALGAIVLWAAFASMVGQARDVPPWLLTGISLCIGSLVSLPRMRAWRVPVRTWAFGAGCLFVYHVCLIGAFRLAPVAEANLINYLWPLLMVMLSGFVGRRATSAAAAIATPRLRAWLGCGIAFAGCALAIQPSGGSAAFTMTQLAGYACAAVAALTWAIYSLGSRWLPPYSSWAVGGFCLGAGLLALAGHFTFEARYVPTGANWIAMAAIGLGPLGYAFVLWDRAMRAGDAAKIGTVAYATPVLSMLGLALTLRDTHTNWPLIFTASALIVLGVLVGTLEPRRREQAS